MTIINFTLLLLLRLVASLMLLVLLTIGFQYLTATIYNFKETKPFQGANWHNPYLEMDTIAVKANFHAHSSAWKGVTCGSNSSKEMVKAYRKNDYDICPMSNYFSLDTTGISENELFIPAYEHGLNIFKSHCLVLNPKSVSYYDYFLYQTPSFQQKVIDKIKENGGIIALAHPELMHGRSKDDLTYLTHYDLVEVLNHYRISDEHWDAALSSGKLVYILADDDSHEIDSAEMFRMWNVIFPKKRTKEAVLYALTHGQSVGVQTEHNFAENIFKSCKISGDTLEVVFKNSVDQLQFIGQGGKVEMELSGVNTGTYMLKKDDTYIRVVAKNGQSAIYLNPVTRYQKRVVLNSEIQSEEKTLQTWLFRAFMLFIESALLWLLYLTWKRKTSRIR